MSYSISTLLIRNLREVFGENDPTRRRAAIDEIWAEDGVFYDPSKGAYRGRDDIDRVAGATGSSQAHSVVVAKSGRSRRTGAPRLSLAAYVEMDGCRGHPGACGGD